MMKETDVYYIKLFLRTDLAKNNGALLRDGKLEFFGGIFMRKCIRCGSEMKENCAIKIKGAGYGIVMSSDENKLFGGRMGEPKVAICPACGEVSIYVEDLDKLK